MTELAVLEQRRQLVKLSCDLQRATLSRRLAYVDAHPTRAALGIAFAMARRPAALRAMAAMALLAWRALRRARG
jgi:hypothetical protein